MSKSRKKEKVKSADIEEYNELFHEYLLKKQKYQKDRKKYIQNMIQNKSLTLQEKKMNLKRYQTKCIFCKQNVGTIFKESENDFSIQCGNRTNPCIKDKFIKRKHFDVIPNLIQKIEDNIQYVKNEIIKLKYHSLFELETPSIVEKQFSELKQRFIQMNGQLNLLLMKYKQYQEKDHDMNLKQKEIQRYTVEIKAKMNSFLETNNFVHISEIVDIYQNMIYPLMKEIQDHYNPKIMISRRDHENETLLHEYTIIKHYNQLYDLEVEIEK